MVQALLQLVTRSVASDPFTCTHLRRQMVAAVMFHRYGDLIDFLGGVSSVLSWGVMSCGLVVESSVVASFREALWPSISWFIREHYGSRTTAAQTGVRGPRPGPLSFADWCRFMGQRGAPCDDLLLLGFVLMTGFHVTVVDGSNRARWWERQFGHDVSVLDPVGGHPVDVVLLEVNGQFSSLSEYCSTGD